MFSNISTALMTVAVAVFLPFPQYGNIAKNPKPALLILMFIATTDCRFSDSSICE